MAHIELTEGLPGIRGPMVFSPETTKPLGELVQAMSKQQTICWQARTGRWCVQIRPTPLQIRSALKGKRELGRSSSK